MSSELKKSPLYLLYGLFLGLGEIIPGVGAQTAAILLGIFDRLITLLYGYTELLKVIILFITKKKKFSDVKKVFFSINWVLSIFVGIGTPLSILILSGFVSRLLEQYPEYVFAIATGIVLATLFIPWKEMEQRRLQEFAIIIITAIIFLIIFGLEGYSLAGSVSPLVLFIAGLVSSVAGFFPGVSISFALLLMGLYQYMILLAHRFSSLTFSMTDVINIISFVSGTSIGGVVLVRTMKQILDKYKSLLLAFIIGLMLASLRTIWPFIDRLSAASPEDMLKVSPFMYSPLQILSIIITIVISFIIIFFLKSRLPDTNSFGISGSKKDQV